jgi:UPF0716 family protein affecting phage T7 exclusion
LHFATRGSGQADEVVMDVRRRIKAIVFAWLAAEVVAFATAVHFLGWPTTLALGFLTSVFGIYILRVAGRESLGVLKRAMEAPSGFGVEAPSGGVLRILSGFLLVIPGFVSDLAGLLLLAPFIRERLTTGIVGPRPRRSPNGVVDLDPNEWRAGQGQDPGPSCEPLPGMLPGEPKAAHSRRQVDE